MTLGQKIKNLREESGLLQKELAAKLKIGDGYLSKVESNQKSIKRAHLNTLSEIFECSLSELESLWVGTKVYEIIKNESEGYNALKVAEEQLNYKIIENAKV